MKRKATFAIIAFVISVSAAMTACVRQRPLRVVSPQLKMEVSLPAFFRDRVEVSVEEFQYNEETVKRLNIAYKTPQQCANVLSFENLSAAEYEKRLLEGGPTGLFLGQSSENRVILFWGLQSNPFQEGSEEFLLFQNFPKEVKGILDSFRFLKE